MINIHNHLRISSDGMTYLIVQVQSTGFYDYIITSELISNPLFCFKLFGYQFSLDKSLALVHLTHSFFEQLMSGSRSI